VVKRKNKMVSKKEMLILGAVGIGAVALAAHLSGDSGYGGGGGMSIIPRAGGILGTTQPSIPSYEEIPPIILPPEPAVAFAIPEYTFPTNILNPEPFQVKKSGVGESAYQKLMSTPDVGYSKKETSIESAPAVYKPGSIPVAGQLTPTGTIVATSPLTSEGYATWGYGIPQLPGVKVPTIHLGSPVEAAKKIGSTIIEKTPVPIVGVEVGKKVYSAGKSVLSKLPNKLGKIGEKNK
jgi:hypothetical protein